MTPEEAVSTVNYIKFLPEHFAMCQEYIDALQECHRLAKAFLELEKQVKCGSCRNPSRTDILNAIRILKSPPPPEPEPEWRGQVKKIREKISIGSREYWAQQKNLLAEIDRMLEGK